MFELDSRSQSKRAMTKDGIRKGTGSGEWGDVLDVSRRAVGPWLAVEHALHGLNHYQPLCRVNGVPWKRRAPAESGGHKHGAIIASSLVLESPPPRAPPPLRVIGAAAPGSATIGPEYLWEGTSRLAAKEDRIQKCLHCCTKPI